jgi:hypothetical protein
MVADFETANPYKTFLPRMGTDVHGWITPNPYPSVASDSVSGPEGIPSSPFAAAREILYQDYSGLSIRAYPRDQRRIHFLCCLRCLL